MRKFLYAVLIAFIFSSHLQAAQCEYEETIIFSGLDWDSNRFHNEVVRYILENGYGCKTDVIPGTTLPLLTALAKGDVHVTMEIWEQNIREAWAKLMREGSVVELGVNFPDAVQGFYVPTYVIKGDPERGIDPVAPDLESIEDLIKYRHLFPDPEVEGKSRFYNCILGWSCEGVNTKKLHAYGLDKYFTNFRPGASASLSSALAAAYNRGQPIFAYYWGPTWVLGKYDLTLIKEPPFDERIWNQLVKQKNPTAATAYPIVQVLKAANKEFAEKAPVAVKFLREYNTTNAEVSSALSYLQDHPEASMRDAAVNYLKQNEETWRTWVEDSVATKVKDSLQNSKTEESEPYIISIEKPVNDFINYLVREHDAVFAAIASPLLQLILIAERTLLFCPWWLFILLLGALSFLIEKNIKLSVIVVACLLSIAVLGLWEMAIDTLALMIISTLVSVVVGIPIGILISFNARMRAMILPVLDAMQTMPSFVYLIPALMLFGLGKVPALFATVIYAVTPLIRLTNHGILMVDSQIIEAGRAFGASRSQLLVGVQLPLALKTIMAGINQTTMLALSMVVIASMIGARGLGEQVLLGIQKLDVGQGFTAGLGIVALAIMLDRITQAFGRKINPVK